MRTVRLLPVSTSMHCLGGYLQGGVPGPGRLGSVPGPRGYLPGTCLGGGCTWSQGCTWSCDGVYLVLGGTCPGTAPPPWTEWLTDKCNKECFSALCCASVMLFSIVLCFGNTWFLLCLEWLDADWLSCCVCLEGLHSDFCCMLYCYHTFSLDECPFCPVGGRIICCACILIGWVVCSGLEKKDASMFEVVSNSFVISEINLYQSYLKASI